MTKLVSVVTSERNGGAAGRDLAEKMTRALEGRTPALLLCFASMKQPLGEVLAALASAFPAAALAGASTAGEFTEQGEHVESAVLTAVIGDYVARVAMAEGLRADVGAAAERAVTALPPRAEGYPHRTAILLFDGLAGLGEEATLSCAGLLGPEVGVAGAAAGDDWAAQSTFVGAGAHAATDALVLAVIDSRVPLGIGVAHGHRSIGVRTVVTRAEGSVVHELDGKPAWARYADLTRAHSVPTWGVDPDSITDAGKRLGFFAWYQTGINLGEGFKNRTPLARLPGDALAYACGIPEGTELELLASTADAQVESARAAATMARQKLGGRAPAGALVFECGCRKVYLGDRFGEAPAAVSAVLDGTPLGGFESYGEVALNVGDFSGFHNATTVVLAFPRDEDV